MPPLRPKPSLHLLPLTLVLVYALVGGVWILLSDRMLSALVADPAAVNRLQTYKGWFYVAVTAAALYVIIKFYVRSLEKAEEARAKSEQQFHAMIETTLEGVVQVDRRAVIVYVNRRMAELLGYRAEELLGRSLLASVDERDLLAARASLEGCEQGERGQDDLRLKRSDGSPLWTIASTSPLYDEDGSCSGALAMLTDITERMKTEEELWESNRTLNSLIQASPAAIVVLDTEGIVTLWNPAAERIFGWSAAETLGTSSPIVPEDMLDEYRAVRSRVLAGEVMTGVEQQRRKKDGSLIDVSLSTAPLYGAGNTVTGTIVLLTDITTRKRAEAALRESEERYRIVAQAASDAIVTIDEESTIILVNPAAEQIFGYSADELLGKKATLLMPERLRSRHLDALKRHIATGERHIPWVGIGVPGLHKSGREIPLEVSYGEFEKNGHLFFIGFLRDVTERKLAEESLQRSERKYRTLFEESMDAVYISTPGGTLTDINPAGVALFGYASKEELLSLDMAQGLFVHADDGARFMRDLAERGFVKDFEVEMRKKNGERLTAVVTATAVRDDRGAVSAHRGFIRDITAQKKLEQQLIQAQKMEAVGKLAGGVAHDFNNILTAVISYGNLLQMSLKEDEPAQAHIEQILALADRAATLTQSLLAFSRRQIMNPRPVDLNEIIRRVEKILSRLIGEDIELRTHSAAAPLIVMADAGQIEQVLINLATNARDAMPDGGMLTISTDAKDITEEFVRVHGFGVPGAFALLTVADTGLGMSEETKARAFEPFYTTKEVGKGTGLGLAIVWGIIKQHNGYITLYSEPGKGTTFRIYLPLTGVRSEQEATVVPPSARAAGDETVLVAEDEQEVRKTTVALLKKFGYRVIEAEDGEEAVQKFREHRDRIRLLLFDVVMPRKNGKEAYEEIRRLQPDVKVLFTSGYPSDIMYKRGILDEGFPFLSKPFTPRDLLKTIREVLGHGSTTEG